MATGNKDRLRLKEMYVNYAFSVTLGKPNANITDLDIEKLTSSADKFAELMLKDGTK